MKRRPKKGGITKLKGRRRGAQLCGKLPWKGEEEEEEGTVKLKRGTGNGSGVVNHRAVVRNNWQKRDKSGISRATELGNCLLKNRNDVNPAAWQRRIQASVSPARAPPQSQGNKTRIRPRAASGSVSRSALGGIIRNKINVTQSRLSFEISLPVLAADKCSIPTTCIRTPVSLIPRRPRRSVGARKR